jgi:hypothetical protein
VAAVDLNRLTEKSQEALQRAQSLATRRSHQAVDDERLVSKIEEDRGSRVILLVHREEKTNFLGFPARRVLSGGNDKRPGRAQRRPEPSAFFFAIFRSSPNCHLPDWGMASALLL